MEKKFTYCRICEGSCGFVAEIKDNKLIKYYPDKNHPVSKGYSCIKGRNMINIQNNPKLLKYPLKKNSKGEFKRISWDQAIDEIGGKLLQIKEDFGPNSIGLYFGNPTAFSYSMTMYSALFMKFLGSRNLYSAGSQDCNNKFAHSKRFYGSSLIIIVPDFDRIDYLLALGTNPAASHFSFVVFPRPMQRLRKMEKRGAKIVWVNPRRIEAAKKLGEHIFIKPNTDIYLLFGMINYVLENGLEDKEFIEKYSKKIDDLKEIAHEFGHDLDKIEKIAGIKKETIIRITNDFIEASKKGGAAVYGRAGTDRGSFATLLAWAIDVFNFITGNIDKKGNFYSYGVIDALSVSQMGGMDSSKKDKKRKTGSRIGNFPSVLGTYPAGTMADEILTPGEGQIKAMIVMAGDPLVSCPNARKLKSAFEQLEIRVSIDFFMNDTGCISDYILPATTSLEREDFMLTTSSFNPIPFAGYTDAVLEPGSERKLEWEIFNRLCDRMSLVKLGGPPIKTFQLALSRKDRKRFKSLIKSEKGIYLNEEKKLEYNVLFPDRIPHSDKLIDLVPSDYLSEFEKLRNWKPIDDGYFKLISGRQIETINSWIHTHCETNYCHINVDDAQKLGIEDHQTIRVKNKIGFIDIEAKLTPDLLEGVIWIPHGWGHTIKDKPSIAREKRGINVNLITDDNWKNLESFAGMAFLDGFPVKIEKI
jgi:formate dehydrogenase